MQTLYIDVYFLINFTVDFIALYFAVTFAKVPSGTRRLLFGALIGALCSVLYVLSPEKAYFKRAILLRNRYMVDRADLVVVYVERTTGGAYQALQYAQKQGKTVINLADSNLTLS